MLACSKLGAGKPPFESSEAFLRPSSKTGLKKKNTLKTCRGTSVFSEGPREDFYGVNFIETMNFRIKK